MMTTRNPDDDGNAHLELRDLRKEYSGRVTAVDGVSLSLSRGELLVLVGPSGCGKSTTLRCIAGLEDASAGDIRVAGESIRDRPPEARGVAMVFQNYALYPHKTARENIGFGLRMTTDLPEQAIRDRVEDVAGTLGITDLLGKKPASLSVRPAETRRGPGRWPAPGRPAAADRPTARPASRRAGR